MPPKNLAAVKRFIRDDGGATSIEYAMIAAGVAVAIIVAVVALGTSMKTQLWDKVSSSL